MGARVGKAVTLSTGMADYRWQNVPTATTLRVAFVNDDAGAHDVEIDYLSTGKQTLQAEDQAINTGGWNPAEQRCGGGRSRWLHCAGYIEFRPIIKRSRVTVRARGRAGRERIELYANGTKIGKAVTLSTGMADYSWTDVPSATTLRVAFVNDDAGAHDVEIDYLSTGERTLQAEDQAINTGGWNPAEQRCGGGRSQWLHCAGYIEFRPGGKELVSTVEQLDGKRAQLKLYPNPVATGLLTVDFGEGAEVAFQRLEVYDFQGRRVHALELEGRTTLVQLEVGELPAGAYLLVARSAEGSLTRSFEIAR